MSPSRMLPVWLVVTAISLDFGLMGISYRYAGDAAKIQTTTSARSHCQPREKSLAGGSEEDHSGCEQTAKETPKRTERRSQRSLNVIFNHPSQRYPLQSPRAIGTRLPPGTRKRQGHANLFTGSLNHSRERLGNPFQIPSPKRQQFLPRRKITGAQIADVRVEPRRGLDVARRKTAARVAEHRQRSQDTFRNSGSTIARRRPCCRVDRFKHDSHQCAWVHQVC
jgi:hypothetical protein